MAWVDETVEAVHETIGELFPDQVLGVAAVHGDDVACSVRPGEFADRCFEVGSIGKTFTATLLALAVGRGRAALDDPVSRWLDAGANGDLTLEQLATHTSGLPRLDPDHARWDGFDDRDPYRGYTADHAEEALRTIERDEPGAVRYSNFGYQLLGLVVERAFATPIAELVRAELFVPLGMADSAVTGASASPVPGLDASGAPTSAWRTALPGPGGYESTLADMAAYVRAVLAPPSGSLGDAIRLACEPRVDDGGTAVGLAWHRSPGGLLWHNGGTGGFSSMLAVDPAAGRGVVGLLNTADRGPLDEAVATAAAGDDPRAHRREPAGDACDGPALEIADLVIAHDYAGVRARCDEQLAEVLTDEMMAGVFGPAGEPDSSVHARTVHRAYRRGSMISVVVRIEHDDGSLGLETTFDERGALVGLFVR